MEEVGDVIIQRNMMLLTWSEFIDRKGNTGIDYFVCEEIHF